MSEDVAIDAVSETETADAADDAAPDISVDSAPDAVLVDVDVDVATDSADVDVGCDASTVEACGACRRMCSVAGATSAACVAGVCRPACAAGYGDCNSPLAPAPDDGCETRLDSVAACGACGQRCDTAQSNGATCDGTKCNYTSCKPGYTDCNFAPPNTDGCESPIASDPYNCGACGRACALTHVAPAGPSCSGGMCNSACAAGFSNCYKPIVGLDDGCECATPTCCGTGCAVFHRNCLGSHCGAASPLLGQNYYLPAEPCRVQGVPGTAATYTETMANEARTAWPGAAAATTLGRMNCGASSSANAVFAEGPTSCVVWGFGGAYAGYVRYNTAKIGESFCLCPSDADGTWN